MSADFNETRVPTTDWQAYRGVLSRRIFAFLIDYAIVALLWIPAAVVVNVIGASKVTGPGMSPVVMIGPSPMSAPFES